MEIEVKDKRYRAGDTVFIEHDEAIFLGMWKDDCWFYSVEEDTVRRLYRGFFKQKVT